MTIFYIDPENGNDANNGSSFALRRKSLAGISTPVTNDEIRFIASPAPYSIGSGAWVDGNEFVTIAPPAKVIDPGNTNWTAAANVTCSLATSARIVGPNCQQITVAGAFTTGLAAYYPLAAPLDLSAFDQVSFMWLGDGTGTMNLASGYLALCSDAAGAVPVNTIRFNNTNQIGVGGASNIAANFWTPIVVSTGAPLGSNINSIAIYFDVDPGAASMYLENIIATRAANGVNHRSMIGKASVGEPWYFPVCYILDTGIGVGSWGAVLTDAPLLRRPYNGVSESANVFVQQCQLGVLASADRVIPGSAAIKITGGWDRTAMTAQSGQTWYGNNYGGSGGGMFGTGARVITELSNFSFVRWEANPMSQTVQVARQIDFYNGITNTFLNPCAAPIKSDWQIRHFSGNRRWVVDADPALGYPILDIDTVFSPALTSNPEPALRFNSPNVNYSNGRYAARIKACKYSSYFAIQPSSNMDIYGCTFANNTLGDIMYNANQASSAGLIGCSANPVVTSNSLTASGGFGAEVWDATHIWRKGITYTQQATTHNVNATALQGAITISSLFTAAQPALVRLARIAAPTGTLNITASVRKDNAAAYAAIMVKKFSAPGVTADVVSTAVSAANAWQTLSLAVTTTADSVVEVYGVMYGDNTHNAFWGDIAWS